MKGVIFLRFDKEVKVNECNETFSTNVLCIRETKTVLFKCFNFYLVDFVPPQITIGIKIHRFLHFKMFLPTLYLLDPSIGRFDASSIPDQVHMEELIQDLSIPSKQSYKDPNGDMLDACTWSGVTCDDEGRVTEVEFNRALSGVIALRSIPPHVTSFSVRWTSLVATLITAELPVGLRNLTLFANKFFGSVNFRTLPEYLEKMDIAENSFTGSADLTVLPKTLVDLLMHHNKFSGSLSLESLPDSLEMLDGSNNNFEGEISLESLPPKMDTLYLSDNRLSGSLSFGKLPNTLQELWLSNNRFSGEIDLEYIAPGLMTLTIDGNQLCGEFKVTTPPQNLWQVHARGNLFSGTAIVHRQLFNKDMLLETNVLKIVNENGEEYI